MSFCSSCGTELDDAKDSVCTNPACGKSNPHYVGATSSENASARIVTADTMRLGKALLCVASAAVMMFAPLYSLDALFLHTSWSNLDMLFGLPEIGRYADWASLALGLALGLYGILLSIILAVNGVRRLTGKDGLRIGKERRFTPTGRQVPEAWVTVNAITSGDGCSILFYVLFIMILVGILGGSLVGITGWMWALFALGLILVAMEAWSVRSETRTAESRI